MFSPGALKTKEWDNSFRKGQNCILYPKEQVVIFLNRFVRKKDGMNSFKDIMDFSRPVRGIDFGCGIGRQTLLMKEFGIDAWGVDISPEAIRMAKRLSDHLGFPRMRNRFLLTRGLDTGFPDGFFDLAICESVLDSMPFDFARQAIRELERLIQRYAFISLICGCAAKKHSCFNGELTVKTEHEKGTIQSYFDRAKVKKLIGGTRLKIAWWRLIKESSLTDKYRYGRHYLVLAK